MPGMHSSQEWLEGPTWYSQIERFEGTGSASIGGWDRVEEVRAGGGHQSRSSNISWKSLAFRATRYAASRNLQISRISSVSTRLDPRFMGVEGVGQKSWVSKWIGIVIAAEDDDNNNEEEER